MPIITATPFKLSPFPTTWNYQAKLLPQSASANDFFGSVISLSEDGNTLITGSNRIDNGATVNVGRAYIFERSSGSPLWENTANLTSNDNADSDYYAYSVDISNDGTRLVVGAPLEGDGHLYIYEKLGGSPDWENVARIPHPGGGGSSPNFGKGVTISGDGNYIGVAASRYDDPISDTGAAWVFQRTGGSPLWELQTKLTREDLGTTSRLGDEYQDIAMNYSGDIFVCGAAQHASGNGIVQIYRRSGSTWLTGSEVIKINPPTSGEGFGYAVTISNSGNWIMISTGNGKVYTYEATSGSPFNNWSLQQTITGTVNTFGIDAVSISPDGNILTIGERSINSNHGAVHVYERSGSTYSLSYTIDGEDSTLFFGSSVSCSNNGTTIAGGAINDATLATTGGAAFVYTG